MIRLTTIVLLFISSLSYALEEKLVQQPQDDEKTYIAIAGKTLKHTIKRWSQENNYTVKWNVYSDDHSTLDWMIKNDVEIQGSYYQAVDTLLDTYKNKSANVNIAWRFYDGNILSIWKEKR